MGVVAKIHVLYGEMVKAVGVRDEINGNAVDQAKILELCKQHLAECKVPKVVEFRDERPRSPPGKILKKYL